MDEYRYLFFFWTVIDVIALLFLPANRHTTSNTTMTTQHINHRQATAPQHNTEMHRHTTSTSTSASPSPVQVHTSLQVVRGMHKKHLDKLLLHDVNISPNREGAKAHTIQHHTTQHHATATCEKRERESCGKREMKRERKRERDM